MRIVMRIDPAGMTFAVGFIYVVHDVQRVIERFKVIQCHERGQLLVRKFVLGRDLDVGGVVNHN